MKDPVKKIPGYDASITDAFAEVAQTDAGRVVLRWFMQTLGWKAPMLAINPKTQEIIETSTIYNVSKRDVWLTVRGLIPWRSLNAIENERKPKDVYRKPDAAPAAE